MNTRRLYWLALVTSIVDIAACVLAYSIRPEPVLIGIAGFCAALAVPAGKHLWRTRKVKSGVRA